MHSKMWQEFNMSVKIAARKKYAVDNSWQCLQGNQILLNMLTKMDFKFGAQFVKQCCGKK